MVPLRNLIKYIQSAFYFCKLLYTALAQERAEDGRREGEERQREGEEGRFDPRI